MKQYCLSKKYYFLIFLLVCIIHLLFVMVFFIAPPYIDQKVTLSLQDETYHANKLLSSGQETTISLFQHEQPQNASDTSDNDAPSQDCPTTIAEKPAMPSDRTASPLLIKEKKPLPARSSDTPTTHKTRRSNATQGPTLADISRGFLKSVKQHAGHNKAAHNQKELALQVYASKIWNSIKEAFLIGQNHLRLAASVNVQAQLNLTIDRSGKLVDVKLMYPPHATELRPIEDLLIARAHEVGLFPPFSPQMTGQTQRFSFPLVIQGQEGFHSYSLGYR